MLLQILHSICRIAEVLLKLQLVGNVKYTGWTLQVPCSPNREIIGKLQEQAKEMENELQQWKELVTRRREEFYELNYFNTVQLLTLRRELGQVTTDSRILSPDVLALLHSISTQVTPKIIRNAVCQVTEPENAECELEDPVADDSLNVDGVSEIKSLDEVEDEVEDEVHMDVGQRQSATLKPEDDLSAEQKELMANISSRLNCSNSLVCKAFQECSGQENNRYVLEQWCVDNMDKDELLEDKDESSEIDSDSGESSDSDDSIVEDHNFTHSASMYPYQRVH